MLCPCDLVSVHDHQAIFLVSVAALFGGGAAWLIYRRMQRDSGATVFLKVFGALVIVFAAVYAELFLAMEVVAWLARSR